MKTIGWALAGLGLMAAAGWAEVTKEDLKRLAQSGVGDDVIVSFVRTHGPVPAWSAEDLADLKKAGLSDRVILLLISLAPPAKPGEAAPLPAEGAGPAAAPTPPPASAEVYASTVPVADPYSYSPYPYSYPIFGVYPAFTFRTGFFFRPRMALGFRGRGFAVRR